MKHFDLEWVPPEADSKNSCLTEDSTMHFIRKSADVKPQKEAYAECVHKQLPLWASMLVSAGDL